MKPFQLIRLHDQIWLENQRIAGKVAKECQLLAKDLINANQSLLKISEECHSLMMRNDCVPTFLGYKGFPGAICTSVNNQLVHGIPTDYIPKDGDLVKIDLGVTYKGAIADCAFTMIKGTPINPKHLELVHACEKALDNAIQAIKVGKKIGCIGAAISYIHKKSTFGLITNYGGHSMDYNKPHADPFVNNKSSSQDGVTIQPGLVLCIEPMFTLKDTQTWTLTDGWTVMTKDVSAHFEKTVFIHEDRVEVIA